MFRGASLANFAGVSGAEALALEVGFKTGFKAVFALDSAVVACGLEFCVQQ
jgi:hypothetical protein